MRPGINVTLLPQEGELDVFAESRDRTDKERAMRRRQLKGLVERLKHLERMPFNDTRQLRLKLGEATGRYRAVWRVLDVALPQAEASRPTAGATGGKPALDHPSFCFRLNRTTLRAVRRREGRYLLRTTLCGRAPEELWQCSIQLPEVEAAFKPLKDDLHLRPIYHPPERRLDAHIVVAVMA